MQDFVAHHCCFTFFLVPQTQNPKHNKSIHKPPADRPSALFPGLAEDGGELMHGTWLLSF